MMNPHDDDLEAGPFGRADTGSIDTGILRASKRHRQIPDSAIDFAIIITDRDGKVTRWDRGAEHVLGWSETEMLGQPADRFLTPEDRSAGRVAAEMRNALEQGRGSDERWYVRKSGERFCASGQMTPLHDDEGNMIGFVVVLRDRTEEHRTREALRRTEEMLHPGEAFWRGLFEGLHDGFMVVEVVRDSNGVARTWRFMEFNAAFERITGLSIETARGRNVEDVIPGVEREWQDVHIRVAETGKPASLRMPVSAMGHVYDVRASRIGPDRVGVLFQEVSAADREEERRTALLKLNDSLLEHDDPTRLTDVAAEILGRTLDLDLVGYGAVDPDAETITVERDWTTDGTPSLAGRLELRDFGSYIDDLKRGETVVISDARTDERTAAFAAALEERSARAFVNTPVFERGRFVALQFASTSRPREWTTGELEFIREVARRTRSAIARREAEGALRDLNTSLERQIVERTRDLDRSRTRASIFFDFTDDYLFLIRVDLDGRARLEDLNRACEAVMGLVRADVVGRPVDELLPANSAVDIVHHAQACLETRLPQTYLAIREYRRGRQSIIEGRVAFVERSDDGGLVLFSGRDVTEQRRTEEALRQAQKMEAVGQLTGGLAHDFNNLLTGMMGNLELLQARVARGRLDDLDRFVNAAQGAGRRAASLTQRLLAFSRRQTLDPKPTDVNRLLVGLEELLRRTVGATAEIEVVQAAGLWTVDVDAGQLENSILNLCINGRDAMPDGGKLTIETANKWIDDRAGRERDLPPGQYISICVTDTGTGMGPETIARAFEPFYTTKPIGQGTGLGLSMIYGFARQSGGQVRIYSELGEGTTVCIYLPRHHGEAISEMDVQQDVVPAGSTGQTVLVVDDEATIRHLIDEVLDELGYTVIGAADGAAGLKVLQSGAGIDLLVTDVGLPNGMNGRQVADAARALRPGLKVLFITGFAENAAVGNGHLEPGMQLLTKPFTLEALAQKVSDMLKPGE